MHRAEKSSSRICRNREVERAQELHRKKLDGVKSYLNSVVSRPPAVKPVASASFRRFKPLSTTSTLSRTNSSGCGSAGIGSYHSSVYDDDLGTEDDEQQIKDSARGSVGACVFDGHAHNGAIDEAFSDEDAMKTRDWEQHAAHNSNAKLDEGRSVTPAVASHGTSHGTQHCYPHRPSPRHVHLPYTQAVPPPLESMGHRTKKTLNRSLRVRRLKEIQLDNVGLFERIKKSAAHYRNDDLKREWEQNVSYLSSICEFPMLLPSPRSDLSLNSSVGSNSDDDLFDASSRGFKASLSRPHENFPSIQSLAVVHPIKAVPTSPRKLQLNLSPAFRSLRKGMPQQPTLPPLTATSRSSSDGAAGSLGPPPAVCLGSGHRIVSDGVAAATAVPSPTLSPLRLHPPEDSSSTSVFSVADDVNDEDDDAGGDGDLSDSQVLSLPSRATSIGSPFVGDLNSPSKARLDASSLASDEAKYQLLKMGRFVGGTYLLLTVFCGDGVRNPYGFDVVAFDREAACEYQLSVSKEMVHELLDTVSSSSQAAITAAAAGTNLSTGDIARCICDHVNFADLGPETGEMLFLAASAGGQTNATLLINSAAASLAFCIHQVVEVVCAGGDSELLGDEAARGDRDGEKRRLHVFASTRPLKTAPSPVSYGVALASEEQTICFQIREDESTSGPTRGAAQQQPHQSPTRVASLPPQTIDLEVEIALPELYEIVSQHWEHWEAGSRSVTKSTSDQRARPQTESVCFSARNQVSVERVVVAALRHLHIVNVPSSDTSDRLTQVLIVNERVNALFRPVKKPKALEPSKLKQQLSRAASPIRKRQLTDRSGLFVLETGSVWKSAYVLAHVSISTGGVDVDASDEVNDEQWDTLRVLPLYIQDVNTPVRISVFNSLTARYSVRELSLDQVACVVGKLAVLTADDDATDDAHECVAFAKQVVARLQIDVDLFGAEVLAFPSLGIKQPLNSRAEQHQRGCGGSLSRSTSQLSSNWSNSRRSLGRQMSHDRAAQHNADVWEAWEHAATLIQASVRGYLVRQQFTDDTDDSGSVDMSDGDVEAGQNGQDECDESRDVHTEMVIGAVRLGLEGGLDVLASSDPTPESVLSTRRSGRKIGYAFCLVRHGGVGFVMTSHVVAIGALGSVEDRSQSEGEEAEAHSSR